MNALNSFLASVMAAVMAPFASLPPWVALFVIAALSGVAAAIAFRYTSPQTALKRVADEIRANLLAMRLFNDDLLVTFKTQGRLLRASGLRLVFSLPPMLVLIVPFLLLLGQMAMYYEFQPLTPVAAGEAASISGRALVRMEILPTAWEELKDVELITPEGVAMEARVPDPTKHTIWWRLRPQQELDSNASLIWRTGDKDIAQKSFTVRNPDAQLAPACPERTASIWMQLLYPAEPAFSATSPVQAISINYPKRSTPIFGINIPWWLTFFIVSMLGALAAKPFVKVQF